jgi:hypothetical protein
VVLEAAVKRERQSLVKHAFHQTLTLIEAFLMDKM